jgi:hypothetical protein
MAEPALPPDQTAVLAKQKARNRALAVSRSRQAQAAEAGKAKLTFADRARAARESEAASKPSFTDDWLGRAAQGSRQVVRGAVGLLDMVPRAVTGLQNLGPNFRNASQPYGPREKTVTPQELFGGDLPTDFVDRYMPTVSGHENDVLNLPLEVAGGLLAGGGFRNLVGGGRAAARTGARETAVLPETLAAAPVARTGVVPAVARGARTVGQALARAGVRTGVTTAGMIGGRKLGGYAGRSIGEALGGEQWGKFGEHYGEEAGGIVVPGAIDAARVPFYRGMNYAYTKPGDVNTPGSSAHTLQAMDDLGYITDLGHVGNAAAANLLDITAGLPAGGAPAQRSRVDLYNNLEQSIANAAAERRRLAMGGSGPLDQFSGVGRNIDEVNIGTRANQAGVEARGAPDIDAGIPSRGIHQALERNYNDPRTGLHREDPATGEPILGRDDPIVVQSEHGAYNEILADPETAQVPAQQALDIVRGELTGSSNLVVDPALEARIDAQVAALQNQRASYAPGSPTLARIDESIATLEDSRGANRGPSFQAQRDLRARGRTRGGIDVLGEQIGDASYAAKTATMRQAAEDRGLGNVFDTAEAEAGRLLRQREATDKLDPDRTGQEGFNQLFKSGKGDLEQLEALMEHAPADTGMAFADALELGGRGKAAAGTRDMNPAAYKPEEIVRLWDNASPQARDVYAPQGTPLRRHMEAVVTAARADSLRSAARTKPGRGSTTIGGPQRYFTNPVSLITGGTIAGSLLGVPGLGFLAGTLPHAAARLVGNRFTDPNFVRNVVHPPGVRGTLDLSRLLAAAVGGNAEPPGEPVSTNAPASISNPRGPGVGKKALTAIDRKAGEFVRRPLRTLGLPGF